MQYTAEIDVTGRHGPHCSQICITKRRAPMRRQIRQMLQLLGIPGPDEVGEQGQRARNGTLFITTTSPFRTNGIRMNGALVKCEPCDGAAISCDPSSSESGFRVSMRTMQPRESGGSAALDLTTNRRFVPEPTEEFGQ